MAIVACTTVQESAQYLYMEITEIWFSCAENQHGIAKKKHEVARSPAAEPDWQG